MGRPVRPDGRLEVMSGSSKDPVGSKSSKEKPKEPGGRRITGKKASKEKGKEKEAASRRGSGGRGT